MPTFEKTRFQHGAVEDGGFDDLFPEHEQAYRRTFAEIYE
jgi:asparagine synthase (glutamine-hydrolysing)